MGKAKNLFNTIESILSLMVLLELLFFVHTLSHSSALSYLVLTI